MCIKETFNIVLISGVCIVEFLITTLQKTLIIIKVLMNTYIKYSDILLNPFSKSIEGEIRLKFYSKVRSENFPNLL